MFKDVRMIDCDAWDELVEKTYGKPYCFQQQNDCQPRGTYNLSVPVDSKEYDFENDEIPFGINGDEMGVSFEAWLKADPEEIKTNFGDESWRAEMFWNRNFYPAIEVVANDLYEQGLLPAGEYVINIDW